MTVKQPLNKIETFREKDQKSDVPFLQKEKNCPQISQIFTDFKRS